MICAIDFVLCRCIAAELGCHEN